MVKLSKSFKIMLLSFSFLLGFASGANAKFYKYRYFIEPGDSFVKVLKKFTKDGLKLSKKSPFVQETMQSNPEIKSWKSLSGIESLTVAVDKESVDKKKLKALIKSKKAVSYKKWLLSQGGAVSQTKAQEQTQSSPGQPQGLTGSVFYMGSMGSFEQVFVNTTKTINQNSPLSLGVTLNYYLKDSLLSFAGSAYYSMLQSPTNKDTGEIVELPPEIGGNLYLQYNLFQNGFSFFLGGDLEMFTTFYEEGSDALNQNTVAYATGGLGKVFTFAGTQSIFLKLSYSHALVSIIAPTDGQTPPSTTYTGSKIMAYLNYKFMKNWFIHGIYKMHSMTGPDELSVSRLGGGFGYAF